MMKKLLQIGKVKGAFNIVAVLGFFASRIDSVCIPSLGGVEAIANRKNSIWGGFLKPTIFNAP
jgi:hypothetical protein